MARDDQGTYCRDLEPLFNSPSLREPQPIRSIHDFFDEARDSLLGLKTVEAIIRRECPESQLPAAYAGMSIRAWHCTQASPQFLGVVRGIYEPGLPRFQERPIHSFVEEGIRVCLERAQILARVWGCDEEDPWQNAGGSPEKWLMIGKGILERLDSVRAVWTFRTDVNSLAEELRFESERVATAEEDAGEN
jgi:hypothetical protein